MYLIAFSVANSKSLEKVVTCWYPELLKNHSEGPPVVLVGLKSELRKDDKMIEYLEAQGKEMVSQEEAERIAKQIKAFKYIECSAKENKGVKEVFEMAADFALNYDEAEFPWSFENHSQFPKEIHENVLCLLLCLNRKLPNHLKLPKPLLSVICTMTLAPMTIKKIVHMDSEEYKKYLADCDD